MAALTKENLLVTIGASGSAVTSGVLVSDASITLAPEIESRRTITASPSWGHSGPPQNSIILRGNLARNMATILSYATGEIAPLVIRTSSGVFSGCYLSEYEIEGNSHSPIGYMAEFKFWQAPTGSFNSAYTLTGTSGIAVEVPFHASVSTFLQTGIVFPDDFSYRVQSERIPRFIVGSSVPSAVKLARLEKELSLKGKNVTGFLGISGSSGSAAFTLTNPVGSGSFSVAISGNLTSQSFNLGNLLQTDIIIKEFVR